MYSEDVITQENMTCIHVLVFWKLIAYDDFVCLCVCLLFDKSMSTHIYIYIYTQAQTLPPLMLILHHPFSGGSALRTLRPLNGYP